MIWQWYHALLKCNTHRLKSSETVIDRTIYVKSRLAMGRVITLYEWEHEGDHIIWVRAWGWSHFMWEHEDDHVIRVRAWGWSCYMSKSVRVITLWESEHEDVHVIWVRAWGWSRYMSESMRVITLSEWEHEGDHVIWVRTWGDPIIWERAWGWSHYMSENTRLMWEHEGGWLRYVSESMRVIMLHEWEHEGDHVIWESISNYDYYIWVWIKHIFMYNIYLYFSQIRCHVHYLRVLWA